MPQQDLGLGGELGRRGVARDAAVLDEGDAVGDPEVGILLVEQKVDAVLRVADRIALIENGRIARHATPAELTAEPEILLRYVGVRR